MQARELDPVTKKDMTSITDDLFPYNRTYEESQQIYSKWAKAGSYDTMLQSHQEHYAGPFQVRSQMEKLFKKPEDVLVLDLGSGSGIIGEMLKEMGFTNIHALEPNDEFVKISNKKGIYKKMMQQFIGNGAIVDADNDTYDVIVTVGTFCPGHIPCDSLHEVIRVLKPGGYFINCMREEFLLEVPEYKDRLEPLMNKLEGEGKWKRVAWDKYDNHYVNRIGIMMVYQKC